jgi:hypothetical protein
MRSGPNFFGDCTQSGPESQDRTVSQSRPDCIVVQTGLDREIILRSGLKIRDRTAYKSVWSGPVSLVMFQSLANLLSLVGSPKCEQHDP